MRQIDSIFLYTDFMGTAVTTPVLQAGKGSPHIVMVALQHGWELIGLDTALRVMDGQHIQGTITLISVASPMAFQDNHRITGNNLGPSSQQPTNMNRVWPGKNDGTIAERSAFAIDQYITSLSPQYVIDLHSYASQSTPHVIVDPSQDVETEKRIKTWAIGSQVPWYMEYSEEKLSSQSLDKALSAIWVNRCIPSVTIELGPLGVFSPEESSRAQAALNNLLISCGGLKGKIENQMTDNLDGTVWQRNEIFYKGDGSGYLRPRIPILTSIAQGEALGEVVSPDGKIQGEIVAPESGVHFIWHNEYRVSHGSMVAVMLSKYNK